MSYKITVVNKSAAQKTFFIFSEMPAVGDNQVFTKSFLSGTIASGGQITFSFERAIYAVCGKAELQNGVKITESFPSTALTLGTATSKGTTLSFKVEKSVPSFATPYPDPDAGPGSFRIKTGADFSLGDPYFLGVGNKAVDDSAEIVPVASVAAGPNSTFDFTPQIVYYVAAGSFTPGIVFDVNQAGPSKKIAFTGGTVEGTATYNPDGTWS